MAQDDGSGGTEYSENDLAYLDKNLAEFELGMAPSPLAGGGGGFMIDPERAEACIAEMTRIVGEVRAASMMMTALTMFAPLGSDEVSKNFANNAVVMAGRAEAFVRTWADQIEATRDGLQAQLDAYRRTDEDNASRLT